MISAGLPPFVASASALDGLLERIDRLDAGALLAVDTEFVRERTYYPQLCLVQIAGEGFAAAVDCLAPIELEPLYELLFRPERTWLLHSARQDLEVVWQRTGRMPPRLIDTQIGAALIGWAPQIGLEDLLARLVGVTLGESYARTDWSRRPLPEPALDYALEDVRHLPPAWQELRERLVGLNRLEWVAEDIARLLAEQPVAEPVTVWLKLKGMQALKPAARAAAFTLVRWREGAAQRSDRPRRWLLADDVLLAIAAALPASPADLSQWVGPKFAARFGPEVLRAVAESEDPDVRALVAEHTGQPLPDKQHMKALQEAVREKAGALGIEPEILATRRDLALLAAGNPPAHLTQGWRAGVLGSLR